MWRRRESWRERMVDRRINSSKHGHARFGRLWPARIGVVACSRLVKLVRDKVKRERDSLDVLRWRCTQLWHAL